MAYEVNYDDKRLTDIKAEEATDLSNLEKSYTDRANNVYQKYKELGDKTLEWADEQSKIQQEKTDFEIDKIEQEKEQANKDYIKEQSGAYVDWQKQSNKYGAKAEQMASMGMTGTGFSESSQVSMYNTYQNRVAAARESFNKIVTNFNNQIAEAKLQNSSILAEIALEAQKQQSEYLVQGVLHKDQILSELATKKIETKNHHLSKWEGVLNQINIENAAKQSQDNWEKEYALSERQVKLQEDELALEKSQASSGGTSGSSSSGYGGNGAYIEKGNAVNTPYYQGALNSDANIYGTFSNGYQPKGISGHGTLSKSKKNGKTETITIQTQRLDGQKQTVVQNVWKAEDGTKWYWEGRQNKYIQIK